ncbi:hypothetical protein [Stenotrophomonas acidaminiphila]
MDDATQSALYDAVNNDDSEAFARLVPSISKDDLTRSFYTAVQQGSYTGAMMFLQHLDAKDNESAALAIAASNWHEDLVQLLAPISDVAEAKRTLSDSEIPRHVLDRLIDMIDKAA